MDIFSEMQELERFIYSISCLLVRRGKRLHLLFKFSRLRWDADHWKLFISCISAILFFIIVLSFWCYFPGSIFWVIHVRSVRRSKISAAARLVFFDLGDSLNRLSGCISALSVFSFGGNFFRILSAVFGAIK